MKRIKFFFIRNYQRFIRFLISLSVVSVFIFGAFSVSAQEVYQASISQPQLTGNDCYLEVVTANDWRLVIYISRQDIFTGSNGSSNGDSSFSAIVRDNSLVISPNFALSSDVGTSTSWGFAYDVRWNTVSALGKTSDSLTMFFYLGNSGAITKIHGYNCDVSSITGTSNDFVFSYGMDTTFNNLLTSIYNTCRSTNLKVQDISTKLANLFNINRAFFANVNMAQILQAIQDNKSSAEKEQYSGASTEQKKAQSDLDNSEKKISDDTAEARSTTINIFKNFSVVGDISKGLLSVTALFNDLCLRFSPSAGLLNFSLALGIGAFLLGVSAYVVSKVIHRGGK